jgi:hypothetical protein
MTEISVTIKSFLVISYVRIESDSGSLPRVISLT